MQITQTGLIEIAGSGEQATPNAPLRDMTAWEFTTFVRPMSVGHFRRVLKETPELPQGHVAGDSTAPNATRGFAPGEVARLRTYFDTYGRQPKIGKPDRAPIVSVVHTAHGAGKTMSVVHLATAAALDGWKVLVIDADPTGDASRRLAAPDTADHGAGVLPLIARSYGGHLLRANQLRLDHGETPLPMEEAISKAVGLTAHDVIRAGRIPGLDLVAAPASLALADLKLGQWQGMARSWEPWRALYDLIHRDGIADGYDVIFCDTGAGVGPLTLAVAASSDVLVMPVPVRDANAQDAVQRGLRALAAGMSDIQTRANHTARALGREGLTLGWRGVHLLLNGETGGTRAHGAQLRARFGTRVLPDAMPEVAPLRAAEIGQFYDLAPRDLARAAYVPLRESVEACWHGFRKSALTRDA